MTRGVLNNSRDNTRNDRHYLITYTGPGFPRPMERATRDERQARSYARKYAKRGWHVKLRRHNGVGQWELLEEHNAPVSPRA